MIVKGEPSHHVFTEKRLPSYRVNAERLGMGSSLGNSSVWVNTKSTGDIERVFCVTQGIVAIGSICVRYGVVGRPLRELWMDHQEDPSGRTYSAISTDGTTVEFEIHPAYQRRTFTLAGALRVEETTFVPLLGHAEARNDPPIVYQHIHIHNISDTEHDIRIAGYARLRGDTQDDVVARMDDDALGLIANNQSNPSLVRIFAMTEKPSSFETSFDFGAVYHTSHMHPLRGTADAQGDILGALQLEIQLEPDAHKRFAFKAAVYSNGTEDAKRRFSENIAGRDALMETIANLEEVIHRSEVVTPDEVINDGALWAKVNMRRVMANYPTGWLFTNDPGVTSNIVCRDCAWFVLGSDYFMPSFSRSLLDTWSQLQFASGKLPEYTDALSGAVEDDGLNINDNTPLFIMAATHHYRSSGDLEWLRSIYPSLKKAGSYIISQLDDRDLVFCSADDPRGNVWAIASWRNIIAKYKINGAVTEINAECVASLLNLAHLSERIEGAAMDAVTFAAASTRIRNAMAKHLINPDSGLFYLNVDVRGNAHTDVTGDQIFPVMFHACDDETSFRIISRLNSPDFWTDAGLRTASALDPLYDPHAYAGLIGGVWPGLTWWYAFAAARYHPEFMVKALRSSFAHYAKDPRRYNTVPGQFSEWFDGDSLANRGMRLSPWEPPRFLWAAIEGVCGLTLSGDVPQINPLVPEDWKWLALRRLRHHGQEIAYFAVRVKGSFQLFTTCEVDTDHPHYVYERDISDRVPMFSRASRAVAFERDREIVVFVGNAGYVTINVPMDLSSILDQSAKYHTRIYNSERDDWETDEVLARKQICAVTATIESQGYRVLHFTRVDE